MYIVVKFCSYNPSSNLKVNLLVEWSFTIWITTLQLEEDGWALVLPKSIFIKLNTWTSWTNSTTLLQLYLDFTNCNNLETSVMVMLYKNTIIFKQNKQYAIFEWVTLQ